MEHRTFFLRRRKTLRVVVQLEHGVPAVSVWGKSTYGVEKIPYAEVSDVTTMTYPRWVGSDMV